MAKDGLDYFPLDCQLDDKLKLIEAEYGITGFAVVVRLFQRIYGGKGYYCEWSNEVALLFAREVGLGGSVVSQILEASIRRGIFSKELFDKCEILTSHGIQKRYLEAVSRRQKVEIEKSYLLVDADNLSKNVYISSKNVCRNDNNADISQQSKVKESKVKYIKDIVAYLNEKTGKQFKDNSKSTQSHISARLAEGYSIEDFKTVIDRKAVEWLTDAKMAQYLRPETLFGTKFESYLNQSDVKQKLKLQRNKFNDYPQRTYTASDYQEIERKLINKGL